MTLLEERPMTNARPVTRRTILTAGIGASAAALAACSSPDPGTAASSPSEPAPGTVVRALADIPVGGSVSVKVDGHPLVLAQPTAGKVVAFSAICTHQGCVVAAKGAEFDCPCHGSRFDAATGAVLSGPATTPLAPLTVTVSGDNVTIA
jgi:Rieske Fe-S protein